MLLVAAIATLAGACGGSGTGAPAGPGPVAGGPSPSSLDAWAIDGTVLTTIGRAPVAGAEVKTDFAGPVTTDTQGRFRLSGTSHPGRASFALTINSAGYLEREVWLQHRPATRALSFDVVVNVAPFSLLFYRQIARDAYEETSFDDLQVWSSAPAFYVRTVDEKGAGIEEAVIRTVTNTIRSAVTEFTGGRFSATVASGAPERRQRFGWVNVNIVRETEDDVCGRAFVGSNPGEITLLAAGCGCSAGRISSAIVAHEVGHALGFFHVADRSSLMYPFARGRCPGMALTAAERHHAAIAYSRPRGNLDPDRDPETSARLARSPRVVVN